jgi:hypothetical protein
MIARSGAHGTCRHGHDQQERCRMTAQSHRLTVPPKKKIGGMLRQQPWEVIGISRATWYRYGKPTSKPEKRPTQKENAAKHSVSLSYLRTLQRRLRVERIKKELPTAEREKLEAALIGKSAYAMESLALEAEYDFWRAHYLSFGVFPSDPEQNVS